jgi:hypothetical protein
VVVEAGCREESIILNTTTLEYTLALLDNADVASEAG